MAMERQAIVVGWGGSAQSYIMGRIKSFGYSINHAGNKDGIKHGGLSFKRASDGKAKSWRWEDLVTKKIIYIYSDPVLCIKSHFKREWARHQKSIMTGIAESFPEDYNEFQEYVVSNQRDPFMLQMHFDNWCDYAPNVIPLQIEDFFEHTEIIKEKLSITDSQINNIEIKARTAYKETEIAEYEEFYKPVYDKVMRKSLEKLYT